MKNKLFWPIILVAIVIIVESLMLLSGSNKTETQLTEVGQIQNEENISSSDIVSFTWTEEGEMATLVMTANSSVAIDALDLYLGYKNAEIDSVTNVGDLAEATFLKISPENSLIVMNYLISEADGLVLDAGQSVRIAEISLMNNSTEPAELFVDTKTQVVENGTAKVLPFNSESLIVNSSSL